MPILRIDLPLHLRRLANIPTHELPLDVPSPVTIASILDALEARHPMLRGTIRDHVTLPTDTPLPDAILTAREPLIILGAIAGG